MTRPSRPWDLFNKNIGRVTFEIADRRMAICKDCEFFVSLTQQCLKCGCIMPAKTKLPNSECPVHKWGQEELGDIGFKE
jgi:hypothetical protein